MSTRVTSSSWATWRKPPSTAAVRLPPASMNTGPGQGGQQGRVAEDAEVAVDPAGGDEVGLPGPDLALRGDQVDLQAGHG